jgi:hypothetical protein
MSMLDEDRQQRVAEHVKALPMDADELQFLREHPGWMQAAWAHPDWPEWQRERMIAAFSGYKKNA